MPKVSVIIPVYGVEKYIERCAVSLFEQTLDDMEFIFVDDCTKDNSISVLEDVIARYPNRKEQIRIIHHPQNKGISRARETGINVAIGEYIGHCDSDDWVEKDMYMTMYTKAIQETLDFVKCYYCHTDEKNKRVQEVFCRSEKNITNEDAIRYLLSNKQWNAIWNTLVKREIYTKNNILYTDYAMMEDFLLSTQLLSYSNHISIIKEPFYNYYSNPNSVCRTNSDQKQMERGLQAFENANKILLFLQKNITNVSLGKEIIILKYLVRRLFITTLKDSRNYSLWETIYNEISFKPCFTKHIAIKERLQYFLAQSKLYPIYASLLKK